MKKVKKNLIKFGLLGIMLLSFIQPIQAEKVNINVNTSFDLGNGARITILPQQSVTNVSLKNISGSPASTLILQLNGTEVWYTSTTNKTILNISYNPTTDTLNYTAIGTEDYLNVTARMQNATSNYSFKLDGTPNQILLSDGSGYVLLSYISWSQHIFEISPEGIIPPGNYIVSGYVFNSLGLPIENARIDNGVNFTFTDANGAWSLSGYGAGNESFLARAMVIIDNRVIVFRNQSNTTNIISNTTINFTMQEKRSGSVATPGFESILTISILIITVLYISRKEPRN